MKNLYLLPILFVIAACQLSEPDPTQQEIEYRKHSGECEIEALHQPQTTSGSGYDGRTNREWYVKAYSDACMKSRGY